MHNEAILLENISKSYHSANNNDSLLVLENVNLSIYEGEFLSILGPSGCGKSTLINIIAGFEKVDTGFAYSYKNIIDKPSPDRAVVFQSSVLFPWLNVKENISYGLKRKKICKSDINKLVKEYLRYVGLENFENYYPSQLSGGMQQRVALLRALIMKPKIILMDEPFASLDSQTRLNMHELLGILLEKQKTTIIFVTHDIEEAIFLSDRICVMSQNPGKIIDEITVNFDRPRSKQLLYDSKFIKLRNFLFDQLVI